MMNTYMAKLSESPVPFLILFATIIVVTVVAKAYAKHKRKRRLRKFAESNLEMTPDEFFTYCGRDKPQYMKRYNFAGVYILYNQSKNQYYIGQAKEVLNRVNNHFRGRGNGDVYADYKYGDKWTIRLIALADSGFTTLNELEREMIHAYNAYEDGYNRTRGNKG